MIRNRKLLSERQRSYLTRKQRRKRQRRHARALRQVSNPLAAAMLLMTGQIPHHLQQPTTLRGIHRLNRELDALHFVFTIEDRDPFSDWPVEGEGWQPEIPRPLRRTTKMFAPADGDTSDWLRLPNGHVICPGPLCEWFCHGRFRAVHHFDTLPDDAELGDSDDHANDADDESPADQRAVAPGAMLKDKRPGGEWSLLYREELQQALPCVNLRWSDRRRASYWIQITRDGQQIITGLRVYSPTFLPLFSLDLSIQNPERQLEPDVARWWRGKYC